MPIDHSGTTTNGGLVLSATGSQWRQSARSLLGQLCLMFVSMLLLVVVPGTSAADDRWHPGIYVKIEDWQLRSPAQMETIYEELRNTPQLRGIKVILLWGRYESRDSRGGASRYDFSQLDQILARLGALENKHLIVALAWREFKSAKGASEILPNDLQGGRAWNADPNRAHTQYEYLWAYRMSNQPGKYAYNLKLWHPTILGRLDAFLAALAAHIDQHPNLTQISTTESAIGEPVTSFVEEGGSAQRQYDGQLAVIRAMKKYFVQSDVVPDFNYSREHVAAMVPILQAEGIGLGSSNSNKSKGLILQPPSGAPGVLTYYPRLSGTVILAPEVQGDDYRSTYGHDTPPDHPRYESIYLRVRDELKANYTVMQRNNPYWLGDASTPSMLKFIQSYPAIVNDRTGAGGLNHLKPKSVR